MVAAGGLSGSTFQSCTALAAGHSPPPHTHTRTHFPQTGLETVSELSALTGLACARGLLSNPSSYTNSKILPPHTHLHSARLHTHTWPVQARTLWAQHSFKLSSATVTLPSVTGKPKAVQGAGSWNEEPHLWVDLLPAGSKVHTQQSPCLLRRTPLFSSCAKVA